MAYSYAQTDWPSSVYMAPFHFVIIELLGLFVLSNEFVLAHVLYFSYFLINADNMK